MTGKPRGNTFTARIAIVSLAAALLTSMVGATPTRADGSLAQDVANYLANKTGLYSVTAIELGVPAVKFS